MSDVHVRIGDYRSAYHSDLDCPALNSKPETYKGRTVMSEDDARAAGFQSCKRCKR